MLDMFLTTAGIRMQFPQQKLCQFDFFYSGKDPGIIQHSLSLSCFLGKESSWIYRECFVLILKVFCFDTEIECGQPLFALPLEKSPS